MYEIQDRVHDLQSILDPEGLPLRSDVLFCRAHGNSKLCDGFTCDTGIECSSGCCASFALLKHDYCQPQIDGACPVNGFKYGPSGDIHHVVEEEVVVPEIAEKPIKEVLEEEFETSDDEDEHDSDILEDSIPLPPEWNEDGTGANPPEE